MEVGPLYFGSIQALEMFSMVDPKEKVIVVWPDARSSLYKYIKSEKLLEKIVLITHNIQEKSRSKNAVKYKLYLLL